MPEKHKTGSITIAALKSVASLQRCHEFSHAISILGARDDLEFPFIKAANVLRLTFDDVGYSSDFGRAASTEDISAIIEFARSWTGVGNLLIHCKAGTSRSPATALISVASIHIPRQSEALHEILALRNYFRPNSSMLKIADELLGDGNLVEATRSHTHPTNPQEVSPATLSLASYFTTG